MTSPVSMTPAPQPEGYRMRRVRNGFIITPSESEFRGEEQRPSHVFESAEALALFVRDWGMRFEECES